MQLHVHNTFSTELPADTQTQNVPRPVAGACFSWVDPVVPAHPERIAASAEVAAMIGLSEADTHSEEFLAVFSGQKVYEGTRPFAMNYGGHQFGAWAGQLGDGRAINLMEVLHQGQSWMLQLKGAGRTPYSRRGDGLAVLRSSIREYLCSEAMHALGVPTTRALSLALTGDQVLRDMLYDGNAAYEKGAIVCRVAPTFIRFGNFEIFAARGDKAVLTQLTDYTIRHFYPELGAPGKNAYIAFFRAVAQRTLDMVLHWQRVGFVHGVMNTDNMSILGLTIDYGPYGWTDHFDFDWTPNTTDAEGKRYRFGRQPEIAQWNLLQLANALYLLVEESDPFVEVLNQFSKDYSLRYYAMMSQKLGLQEPQAGNVELIRALETLLTLTETDMTIFFRLLADVHPETEAPLSVVKAAFYFPDALQGALEERWNNWWRHYQNRLKQENADQNDKKRLMNTVNPKYVLRNYMAQMAIDEADQGRYELLYELETLLKNPYEEQPEMERWFAKRPDWARYKTGCSALSCSS